MKKILTTKKIRKNKVHRGYRPLQMLTCYDYQNACMLDNTELDLILVGDSLGNVILGYDTTVEVSIEEMTVFASAVKRGAKNTFVVGDLPFGTYSTLETALKNSIHLFQKSKVEALKLEGAHPHQLEIIQRLTQTGIPIMGHIGLTPQSVHQLGGYYVHGKKSKTAEALKKQAHALEEAGCFAIVLECVEANLSEEITKDLSIPTIGIGSGTTTDGQVLVLNDLLHLGPLAPPSFCKPITNLYQIKKNYIDQYLSEQKSLSSSLNEAEVTLH